MTDTPDITENTPAIPDEVVEGLIIHESLYVTKDHYSPMTLLENTLEYAGLPDDKAALLDVEGTGSEGSIGASVAEVIRWGHWSEEGYGQVQAVLLLHLTDGRYAILDTGCDTTGWDCRSGADLFVLDESITSHVAAWGEVTPEHRREIKAFERAGEPVLGITAGE